MAERTIFITRFDMDRLMDLIEVTAEYRGKNKPVIDKLEKELDRAVVVEPEDIPADVITMNSKVRLKDLKSGEEIVVTLVFPSDANIKENRISILAPLGTALLGYRIGSIIEWNVPGGLKKWKVENVMYQPEAAGHYDL